ncbi:hypothetical protein JTE90_018800 [Oedothorax gibbosus]|uniref:Uncharacterized protein n=1 Tax=Oedothorax gibbosus TaxID=931172 RepID=A0AAV6TRW2_9ARAC|nr:hypothetical protein JTE90_018800 [Oedothorax gibbosus]
MIVIPALLGWIALGGAFDYFNLTPKSRYQIFDYNAVNQSKVFRPINRTETKYIVVGTLNDAFKFLGMDKDLGLKAIGGGIPFRGYGNYLSHYVDRRMTVEVLFRQDIRTVSTIWVNLNRLA